MILLYVIMSTHCQWCIYEKRETLCNDQPPYRKHWPVVENYIIAGGFERACRANLKAYCCSPTVSPWQSIHCAKHLLTSWVKNAAWITINPQPCIHLYIHDENRKWTLCCLHNGLFVHDKQPGFRRDYLLFFYLCLVVLATWLTGALSIVHKSVFKCSQCFQVNQ